MVPQLDSGVLNHHWINQQSKLEAEKGLELKPETPILLSANTKLVRVGHMTQHGKPVPASRNFCSPWWMHVQSFKNILALSMKDSRWAARVSNAVAEVWGVDCALQINAALKRPLYAWCGPGRPLDKSGKAVAHDDAAAFWFPDPKITQLYIPGLDDWQRHQAGPLWHTVFEQRGIGPMLSAGTQKNLANGLLYADKEALRQDHFKTGRSIPRQ